MVQRDGLRQPFHRGAVTRGCRQKPWEDCLGSIVRKTCRNGCLIPEWASAPVLLAVKQARWMLCPGPLKGVGRSACSVRQRARRPCPCTARGGGVEGGTSRQAGCDSVFISKGAERFACSRLLTCHTDVTRVHAARSLPGRRLPANNKIWSVGFLCAFIFFLSVSLLTRLTPLIQHEVSVILGSWKTWGCVEVFNASFSFTFCSFSVFVRFSVFASFQYFHAHAAFHANAPQEM